MTIREFIQVADEDVSIVVEKDEHTIAAFDAVYADSIIDEILDSEVAHISISATYKGNTTVTITERAADDGDDGGDTEPNDEEP